MPVDYRRPNINARRLGMYLRLIRENALEMTYLEAAAEVGCDPDWLARVETGFAVPTPAEVERIIDGYHARDAKIAEVLIDLASRPTGPPWLAAHLDRLKASDRDWLILESEASIVRSNQLMLVPALLRAEPYARLVLPHIVWDCDVDQEWDLLNSRQQHRPRGQERVIDAMLDESLLVRLVKTPEVEEMAGQLRHLIDHSQRPNTTIRVVPKKAPVSEDRLNPFDILEFPEVNDRVTLAHHAMGTDISNRDATDLWHRIEEIALNAHDSRDLIRRYLSELTGE